MSGINDGVGTYRNQGVQGLQKDQAVIVREQARKNLHRMAIDTEDEAFLTDVLGLDPADDPKPRHRTSA